MMQNEFENVVFTYEIFTLPESLAESEQSKDTFRLFGVQPLYRFSQSTTLLETPALTVENNTVNRVTSGETLTIDGITVPGDDHGNLELYVYIMGDNGELTVTDECKSIFASGSGYSVSENGAVVTDDGAALITNNAFTADIDPDATAGKYYFMLVYGNKYVYVPVRVSQTN